MSRGRTMTNEASDVTTIPTKYVFLHGVEISVYQFMGHGHVGLNTRTPEIFQAAKSLDERGHSKGS
jgi:hypothetical protein